MGSKSTFKYIASFTALLVAAGLFLAAPSFAAKKVLITGSGVGAYKIGTTGAHAVRSDLYTNPKKYPGCDIIPPAVKGKASKAIGVGWSGKTWTRRSKVNAVYVFNDTIGKKRVVTKQGVGVGDTVRKAERRIKHLRKSAHLHKWAPVLSKRSGGNWINFVVNNFTAKGRKITKWSNLKDRPIALIEVTTRRIKKVPYGGSGGC